jgi:WD40 repeat protein
MRSSLVILLLWPVLATGQAVDPDRRNYTVLGGHHRDVSIVVFSPDGKSLVSGDSSGVIRLWEVASAKVKRQFKNGEGTILSMAFSPDGRLVAAGGMMPLRIWSLEDGKELRTFKRDAEIQAVAWSRDGKYVVSAGLEEKIRVRAMNRDAGDAIIDCHSPVTSLAFSPSGELLASGGYDHSVILWEVRTWKMIKVLRGHKETVTSIAISGDGKTLVSGSRDDTVRIWEIASGKELASISVKRENPDETWSSRARAITADGHLLAQGFSDGLVELWDVEKLRKLTTLRGHVDFVPSLDFSPDGRLLATAANDGTVKVWNVKKVLGNK